MNMTDLHRLQKRVGDLARKRKHNEDPKIILLFLLEELGEVARAFLKEEGHKLDNPRILESYKQELGDVLFLLLQLADVKEIDLEEQLNYTIQKLTDRTEGL